MKLINLMTVISLLTLVGCAHKQASKPQESFSTQIKSNDVKQFSYALVAELPKRKDFGGEAKSGIYEGPPKKHKSKTYGGTDYLRPEEFSLLFAESLNLKLNSTKFCRNGYKKLEEKSEPGNIFIKGECNEAADAADRKNFPNPAPQKIKVDVLE